MIVKEERATPKCTNPKCSETTNQLLRGWTEEWMKYRCFHCRKVYKIAKGD